MYIHFHRYCKNYGTTESNLVNNEKNSIFGPKFDSLNYIFHISSGHTYGEHTYCNMDIRVHRYCQTYSTKESNLENNEKCILFYIYFFTFYFLHFLHCFTFHQAHMQLEARTGYSCIYELHIGPLFAKKILVKIFFEKRISIDAEFKGEQLLYNALLSKRNS